MSRDASTYRGSRRNACLRERPKSTWGPQWYYRGHDLTAHKTIHAEKHQRKAPTTSNYAHELLKRGDYAGAVRRVFTRKGKASGRGD